MESCMAPAALFPAPLEIVCEQLRRFFAALMAEVSTRQADRDREKVNRQAERLLAEHGNSILRLAYSYLHNMSDAEEILQDTLIQFLKTAPALDGPEHEKAWLLRVTSKMRQRVLERIAREDTVSSKVVRFPAWRRYVSAAACIALLLAGAVVLPRLLGHPEPEPPVLTVPNIVEAASIQELSKLVGFEVTADFSLPFEAKEITYCSYWNEMAQIEYSDGEYSATYRQSLGTDDNSGDYNVYSDTAVIAVNGMDITLKGTNKVYVLAVWTNGSYAYSLSVSSGVSAENWRTILQPYHLFTSPLPQ